MPVNLSLLKKLPPGVEQGTGLIAGLDECLALGFARLGPAQHEALKRLAGPFTGTPLAALLTDALAAINRSEFLSKHFCTLAAARAAIQGAQYDALFQQAAAALDRTAAEVEPPKPISIEGHHTVWLASTQQWLMEVALAGFKHLSTETLAPFSATLEQMQGEPKLARAAALLTGFLSELLAAQSPDGDGMPIFRWADLWARAMIIAQQPPPQETGAPVNGTFFPLGVDVRAHAHFASLLVYGVLESGKQRRIARVPLSSYKVDVIAQKEIWQLFRPAADALMESLAGQKEVQVSGMQLLGSGDLLWTGKARTGEKFDPPAVAVSAMTTQVIALPPQPPLTRHPVQLAELVHFQNISVRANGNPGALELAAEGCVLPIATERLGPGCELDVKTLEQATELTGLLRFDAGRWEIQPLNVRSKAGKKERVIISGGSALEFCQKDKLKTLATLSERAGKLLRQN